MKITKEQFLKYEDIRLGGETNMFDIEVVKLLSGLEKDIILKIMKNYSELKNKFLKINE